MNQKKDDDADMGDNRNPSAVGAEESMNTLILWNVSKALQRNPYLDLKVAIKRAHDHLDNSRDVHKIITKSPEERHLACALLAWHELGHSSADSLYRFVINKLDGHQQSECEKLTQNTKIKILSPAEESDSDAKYRHNRHKESKTEKSSHKGDKSSKSNLEISSSKSGNIKDSTSSHPKYIRTNNGQANLGNKDSKSSHVKRAHKMESSKSTSSNHKKVFKNDGTCSSASNYCVFNDKSKTELIKVLKCPFMTSGCSRIYKRPSINECVDVDSCQDFDTDSLIGPVVTLPPDTKVVMRLDNQSPCARHQGKKPRANEKDIMSKIDAACCMDSACAERLVELDKATAELRHRAARLARREAERTELLERAETAWKDLELGYQRRLALAEEKEFDMAKQTKKLIEERNSYKQACMNLANLLKEKGEATEKDRQSLVQVEKELCSLACVRMRASEDAARSDSALTEQQIKVSQVDRDLQFKEEQTRRKLLGIQNEVESVRALSIESERAMRAELSALKTQVETVSKQLLKEDNENIKVKAELDSIRSEKLGLVQDLEGCQVSCDSRMQRKMDELKAGREKLEKLKDIVMECKCKIPIDAAVTVKRTPSLVALCTCAPEDRLLESCSCTSLRSQLLSNLLSDLFEGLQSELGEVAAQMPCQYLKCLDDKHNWDKVTIVKSNLRGYFSKLLIGELDIAIATSIEKYHARWVGVSCVDTLRSVPDTGESANEGWQERAIERRAQKLANKLAEQLFKERADKVIERAKDAAKSGPPPCECKETAVFPCLINPPTIGKGGNTEKEGPITTYWRKTCKDVTQLRVQIEDLRKESLKKEDLRRIEEKIFKLVQRPSEFEEPSKAEPKEVKQNESNNIDSNNIKDTKCHNRSVNTETSSRFSTPFSRPTSIRKRNLDANILTKRNSRKGSNEQQVRLNKNLKKIAPVQAFAVNTCFCGNQNIPKLISEDPINHILSVENEDKTSHKQSFLKTSNDQISTSKHPKPISGDVESTVKNMHKNKKLSSCPSGCVCFHKVPSNTSINKLLEKLTKWRTDLVDTSKESDNTSNVMINYDIQNSQQQDVNKTSITNSEKIVDQKISVDVNTIMLPNETESEYMGTINLDKSNEQCKCLKHNIHNTGDTAEESNALFQCLNPKLYECKKSTETDNVILNIKSKNSRQEPIKIIKHKKELSEKEIKKGDFKTRDEINNKAQIGKNVNDRSINDTETVINQIVKSSKLFPCDCDYYVKLLGVTLADISSQRVFHGNHATSRRKNKTDNITNDENMKNIELSINKVKNEQSGDLNLQSCQCHVQFDQFKNYMENNFKKSRIDYSTNDKELDVPSFKETSIKNDETCVCCNNRSFNDSQELEVNTFYLLEEHLKGKLEKLKKSCCLFSSLPADEEEKLFSSILQRVKQVISSSANELLCKCKGETQLDGSWNRANTLLQEYLKTKIKKVQCLCANEDPKQECVLPKVLDEIYCLIEKDFQRLKNVYKFQNTNDNTMTLVDNNKDEEPEKDTNDHKDIIESKDLNSTQQNDQLSQNNTTILKKSKSTQAFVRFGMKSKSCDAIEKEIKIIQTSESIKNVVEKNCDCNSTMDSLSYEIPGDVDNNQCKMTNISKNSSSPYIGFTVDCSCKCALGTCTCIKSTIVKNNDQINNVWNDLTKDNIQSQVKYQYIMNSLSNKYPNHIDKNFRMENLATSPYYNKNLISKITESVFSDEEITLKDSYRTNVVVSNNSANTSNCYLDINDSNAKSGERDIACECRSIKPILKTNTRSESLLTDSINMYKAQTLNCDCYTVPVCHVKMLVDSIEDRIFHLKCTCDSLNPRVCPIHSKRL